MRTLIRAMVMRSAFGMVAFVVTMGVMVSAFAALTATPQRALAAGKWISGSSGEQTVSGAFATWRGEPDAIAGIWSHNNSAADSDNVDELINDLGNWQGNVDLGMWVIHKPNGESWSAAASGAYDARWRTFFTNVQKWLSTHPNQTVYVRPAYEFNGSFMSHYNVYASELDSYKAAFARLSNMRKEIAPRAKIVWPLNDGTSTDIDPRKAYPGADVVDIVGVDSYNQWPWANDASSIASKFGATNGDGSPRGLESWRKYAESLGKPFAIPEWGSCNTSSSICDGGGGDAPEYMKYFHNWLSEHAGTGAGQVVYEVYFNVSDYGSGKFELYPNDHGAAQAAAMYKSLTWGGASSESEMTTTPTPNPNPTPTPVTCTTPDAGFGQAKGSVSVDGTGTYYVWARIKPTATANSFKLDVEGTGGQCAIVIGDSSSLTANTWQWVNYAAAATGTPLKLDLATGAHNVTMTGTEDGLEVDKLLFTPDASCTPQGTGGCNGSGTNTGGADSEAPKITMSKPGAGEEIAGPYDAVYNASDDVGVVKAELLVDGNVHATDTTKASRLFLDVSKLVNGPHTVAVKAYDASGKFGLSPAVNVTTRYGIGGSGDPNAPPVDLTPAIKSLTASPATVTSGGTTKIKWSTANVADGNCSLTPSVLSAAQANGEWTTPALTASVNYTLVCVGTGSASVSKSVSVVVKGAQSNTSAPVSSSPRANTPKSTSSNQSSKVTSATTGQTVTNGSAGGSVSGNTTLDPTNITDSLKPKTITKVEYYDGANLLQTDYTDPFALDTTQLKDGVYTITERTHYNDGSTSELTQTLDVKNVSSKTKGSSKKGAGIWIFLLLLFILAGGFAFFLFLKRRNEDAVYDPYLAGVDTTQIDASAYPPATYNDGTPDWQQGITPQQPGSGDVVVPTEQKRDDWQ